MEARGEWIYVFKMLKENSKKLQKQDNFISKKSVEKKKKPESIYYQQKLQRIFQRRNTSKKKSHLRREV